MGFEAHRSEKNGRPGGQETALVLLMGEIAELRRISPIVRIHSQCTTGDVFHSLRCDCHDQLHLALGAIAAAGAGLLIYEHQEGRGIGLLEKLRAYALQDEGLDTIEANLQLGHAIDLRDYTLPIEILKFLGISSIRLMTGNPEKMGAFATSGIRICERLSASVPANAHSARYLRTKQEKLGHLLQLFPEGIGAAVGPGPGECNKMTRP
jgi:GTP cyclohydrolase II